METIPPREILTLKGRMTISKFRIYSDQFGYKMFAASEPTSGVPPWSDLESDAHVYDDRDSRETKLKYWRANAAMWGLDPACVKIEELVPCESL